MISDRLDALTDYPFPRLDALIADLPLPDGETAIPMWMGEPKHGVPEIARGALASRFDDYGRYPPIEGTPGLRAAITAWLTCRFTLPDGFIDPGRHVMPVAGTREALFMIALAAVPTEKAGKKPTVLMPNPFYQPYKGGALSAGAEAGLSSRVGRRPDFLPDLDSLSHRICSTARRFFIFARPRTRRARSPTATICVGPSIWRAAMTSFWQATSVTPRSMTRRRHRARSRSALKTMTSPTSSPSTRCPSDPACPAFAPASSPAIPTSSRRSCG